MFSLKSPRGDDSSLYTQYTIFDIIKYIAQNYPESVAMDFSKGLKTS